VLRLPSLGHHSKEDGKEKFGAQTYCDLADATRKRNRDVHITKEMMDDALRFVVSRLPKAQQGNDVAKMLNRVSVE